MSANGNGGNRVQMTCQLVSGKDADLIAWYLSLPEGGRNKAIKNMLRRGLGLPEDETDTRPVQVIQPDLSSPQIAAELREMVNEQIRLMMQRLDDYENYVEQRLNGYTPAVQPTLKTMSDQEREKREQNLNKADW